MALFNATLALPLLTAEAGVAPAITAEPDAQPVAPGDMPTGRSGSDWLRQNGEVLALGGFVAAAGLCWAGYGVVKPYFEGQHTNGRQDEQDGEESTEDT